MQRAVAHEPATIKTIFAMSAQVSPSDISIKTLVQKKIQQQSIKANKYSYYEAIAIASKIPEIAEFIEKNKVTNIYASIYKDLWIVEFYSHGQNQ